MQPGIRAAHGRPASKTSPLTDTASLRCAISAIVFAPSNLAEIYVPDAWCPREFANQPRICMKKYRKLIHSVTVFISTLYVLMILDASGRQSHFVSTVIREITAFLPANGAIVEYEIYLAIVPLIVLWVVVLRLTYLSKEERDIEYFKRDKSDKLLRKPRI